jgi:ribosomal protein RSM22 (predicted rRNA methylase)
MELPSALQGALDEALSGLSLRDLSRASEQLSRRYRDELRDGMLHLSSDSAARAYLATRLPATYAAIRSVMAAVAALRPGFVPQTMLDVGAGPGSALWAASDAWPSLAEAQLIEASPAIRSWGERLAGLLPVNVQWRAEDFTAGLPGTAPQQLVTLAYVLSEIPEIARDRLVERLWELTADTLLIVEPGTPAGWKRILRARQQLLEVGAHFVAPCPHAQACPLSAPDWCHFSRRVARTRLHRQAKQGVVPWEDEKFSYFVASRFPGPVPAGRVIATPRQASGRTTLRLCTAGGADVTRLVSRREGDAYREARRADWGDAWWDGNDGADS